MNQNQDNVKIGNNNQYRRERDDKKSAYISSLYAREDATLQSVQKSIIDNNIRPINLAPAEAKIVHLLLRLHKTKTMIEIGTLVGYSTIWLARALPADGRLYTFEKDPGVAEIAKRNIAASDVAGKIEIIVGDAHAELEKLSPKGPFDSIFIDAEKNGYPSYLAWAEKNIVKGGLILADNTFLFGEVFEENPDNKMAQLMKNFNRDLADSSKYDSVIIPTNEGLSVAIKKF